MLTNSVGPQMVGATDLRSTLGKPIDKALENSLKSSSSEATFGKALQDKMSMKDPKDQRATDVKMPGAKVPDPDAKLKNQKETKNSDDSKDPKEFKDKEDQNAASEDRAEQKVAKPDGINKRKSANRQQAIKEFMDSFESEFEIPPTRLVEAMAKLDDSQLKESPEKTADAVIEQLGLDDAQADKARAMYASLLMQLQQMPQKPNEKPVVEAAGFGASSQQSMQMRMAAAQERQQSMGSAIENLNKKFWMSKEPMQGAAAPELSGDLMQRLRIDDSMLPANTAREMPSSPGGLDELPPHLQGQMKDSISPALLAALAAKRAASGGEAAEASANASAATSTTEDAPELSEEFMKALESPHAEPGSEKSGPNAQNVMAGKAGAQEFFQHQQGESQGQSLMQNSKDFAQQGMAQGKTLAKDKLTTKTADFKSAMTGLEGLQAQPLKAEAMRLDPAAALAVPVAAGANSPNENEAAVKQLMNQAQYLIKQGGGEVKVEMTPEGMGTIHLKVMLQDGKVNLQMSADTQEAKRTIESSLADLKTSLAAHKLSMENVKIDVVNSTSADTATQNQANMNGQGQHREARQFWNQFNENFGNQGRKEAWADFQNIKGYGGKGRDPLKPIETSSVKSAARTVDGKGSGLNLVA